MKYEISGCDQTTRTGGKCGPHREATTLPLTGGAKFATGTNPNPGTNLEVQDDGNAVLYAPGHRAIWASASRSEAAISWFYARLGSAAYEGKCELAVENAFGTSGQYQHRTGQLERPQPAAASHHCPPRRAGLLRHQRCRPRDHQPRHGQVISSSASGRRIGISPISGWFQSPLGWAWAPW
jgi:hypothetical protein